MLACWVLERKHIQAKLALQHMKYFRGFEKTFMSRMFNAQLRLLSDSAWVSGLLGDATPFPDLATSLGAARVELAECMRWKGIHLRCGLIAFMDCAETSLVVVVACLSIDEKFGMLVRRARCTSGGAKLKRSRWQLDPAVAVYSLGDDHVSKPAFHRWLSKDCLEVIH